jgi:catechol 2,3-dioxygenase-like lactoylglutathione lyase family enzyme
LAVAFTDITPVLRIFDENKAKKFYVDYLGFSVAWEHRFEDGLPLYLEVVKGEIALHLSEHHGDCCPGSAVRIEVTGLPSYRDELASKSYAYARPEVEDKPWGTQELAVTDPFGNRLVFVESTDS